MTVISVEEDKRRRELDQLSRAQEIAKEEALRDKIKREQMQKYNTEMQNRKERDYAERAAQQLKERRFSALEALLHNISIAKNDMTQNPSPKTILEANGLIRWVKKASVNASEADVAPSQRPLARDFISSGNPYITYEMRTHAAVIASQRQVATQIAELAQAIDNAQSQMQAAKFNGRRP